MVNYLLLSLPYEKSATLLQHSSTLCNTTLLLPIPSHPIPSFENNCIKKVFCRLRTSTNTYMAIPYLALKLPCGSVKKSKNLKNLVCTLAVSSPRPPVQICTDIPSVPNVPTWISTWNTFWNTDFN